MLTDVFRYLFLCSTSLYGLDSHFTLPSLHLQDVSECELKWLSNAVVAGPLHVSKCRCSSFGPLLAQQLRLHESHDLEFRTPSIHAGVILEECRGVRFTVESSGATNRRQSQEGLRASIKDFCWLRADRPSPNFTVDMISTDGTEISSHSTVSNDADVPKDGHSKATPVASTTATAIATLPTEHAAPLIANDSNDESDDDEL